ncbi:MAG: oligosaccharide flippase family protein [Bacteroidales bacterium]|nr:oligosaccharide flippase family protein [Bacteroidales bacterium]
MSKIFGQDSSSKLAGLFPASSFSKNVLRLVGGTTLAQVVNVVAALILARIYSPNDFGIAAVFISIISVLGVISCLRYENAILLPESNNEAVNVVALSLFVVVILSGLVSLLLLFANEPLLDVLNTRELKPYLWLIPVSLCFNGIYLALTYWNTRTKHFTRLSITKVAASLITNTSQGTIGLISPPNAGGLISGSVLGFVGAATVLGGQIWHDDRVLFKGNVRVNKIFTALKRYRKFPLIDSWGAFLNNLSWQLPALLLAVFFSQAIVGYYSLAYRLIKLPMSLIGSSIGQVFFQNVSEVRDDPDQLAILVKMVFQRLTSIGLFPALLVTVSGPELFRFFLGEKWTEAGVFVQILGLWMFVWFISSPLSYMFTVLEKQEYFLIVHIAILSTRLLSLVVGGLFQNVYIALGLFSGTGILVYGGLAIWNMRLAKVPIRSVTGTLLKYSLYSGPLIGLVLFVKFLVSSNPWMVALTSVFVCIVYYLLIISEYMDNKKSIYSIRSFCFSRIMNLFRFHDHK